MQPLGRGGDPQRAAAPPPLPNRFPILAPTPLSAPFFYYPSTLQSAIDLKPCPKDLKKSGKELRSTEKALETWSGKTDKITRHSPSRRVVVTTQPR